MPQLQRLSVFRLWQTVLHHLGGSTLRNDIQHIAGLPFALVRLHGDGSFPGGIHAEDAEAFLRGFSGWLHADGYQGYHKLPENIRVVGCWAHARRKFDEALQTLPKEMQKDSPAAIGECYCSRLFKLEQALAELTPEERYEKRLEQEKPVLDALLSWANETQAKTAPKSALGRAIHYLLEQWPYLTR